MKIIQKETTGPRAVDWSKPVVVFDPWPFDEGSIEMARGTVYYDGYEWSGDDSSFLWSLCTGDNVLGTTTLGETFVTSKDGLESLS